MNVYISQDKNFSIPIKYIWSVFAQNRNLKFDFVQSRDLAELVIDTDNADITVSSIFYKKLEQRLFSYNNHFANDCLIRTEIGQVDYLSTAFYMLNCLQEYDNNENNFDELGRFKFEKTYQNAFDNIEENLVQQCFDKLATEIPKLNRFGVQSPFKTKIFLSHDIDSVNGALFQDGITAVKSGRFHVLFPLLIHAIINRPDWLNMDKIMKLENEFDFRSTFFWLVNKGRINKREVNADYNIDKKYIRNTLARVESHNCENGLHKSISQDSFLTEIEKLGTKVKGNRYHYLKFRIPDAFEKIEDSGLEADASLGYAESFGFRNSYGLPFNPFNLQNSKTYNFVEIPLNVMDGTFQRYMKVPVHLTADRIISFFEKNKINSIISVLWHNTFFSNYKYKGYLNEYKKLLEYFYENKFECLTLSQIIKDYKWKKILS